MAQISTTFTSPTKDVPVGTTAVVAANLTTAMLTDPTKSLLVTLQSSVDGISFNDEASLNWTGGTGINPGSSQPVMTINLLPLQGKKVRFVLVPSSTISGTPTVTFT